MTRHRCGRDPIQCIVPPYIAERLAESPDPKARSRAIADLKAAVAMRAMREMAQAMPTLLAPMSPQGRKHRLVYDAQQTDRLPGALARSEGQAPSPDVAVNEAYDFSGDTYDFYDKPQGGGRGAGPWQRARMRAAARSGRCVAAAPAALEPRNGRWRKQQ